MGISTATRKLFEKFLRSEVLSKIIINNSSCVSWPKSRVRTISTSILQGCCSLSIIYCCLFAAVSIKAFSAAFAPSNCEHPTGHSTASFSTAIGSSITSTIASISYNQDMPFPYIYDGDRPIPSQELPPWMLSQRTRVLTKSELPSKKNLNGDNNCVLYWMQRDIRTVENWGLLFSQHLAQAKSLPLRVVHILAASGFHGKADDKNLAGDTPPSLENMRMTERHGKFLLGGLECVHNELKEYGVPLDVVHCKQVEDPGGANTHVLGDFLKRHNPAVVICDTSVLRHARRWNESPALREALDTIGVPLYQVDAHNVVPIWYASSKREVGARTLRSKLHKVVDECLQNKEHNNGSVPDFVGNAHRKLSNSEQKEANKEFDYESHEQFLNWDDSVKEVIPEKPGTTAGIQKFQEFKRMGLRHFSMLRNDPNNEGVCSSLSPWFNYGHLSFATCMRLLRIHNRDVEGTAAFIEEGFVRRELSDNFLWYAPDTYDTIEAGAQWAQDSLALHQSDPREYIYNLSEFEEGKTHDDLWNAAQLQMIRKGKMHGFLRMYWAKKILEWTPNPKVALKYAQYLNDKYSLDGRDPNGFCGVAWSIFGNHDMGWKEREIFGKIRFMNYNGCKRKFKVNQFVKKYSPAAKNAMEAKFDPIVASRTEKRNKRVAAVLPMRASSSGSSDKGESVPCKRQKTSTKKKKIEDNLVGTNDDAVEDLCYLSKSAASKKTVKVLKDYLRSKGVSIKDKNGKPLLKAGLVDALMSINA